MVSNLVNMGND